MLRGADLPTDLINGPVGVELSHRKLEVSRSRLIGEDYEEIFIFKKLDNCVTGNGNKVHIGRILVIV